MRGRRNCILMLSQWSAGIAVGAAAAVALAFAAGCVLVTRRRKRRKVGHSDGLHHRCCILHNSADWVYHVHTQMTLLLMS